MFALLRSRVVFTDAEHRAALAARTAALEAVSRLDQIEAGMTDEFTRLREQIRRHCRTAHEDQLVAGARRFFGRNRLEDALILCGDALGHGGDSRFHVAQAIVDYLNYKTFTPTDLSKLVRWLCGRTDIDVTDLYRHVVNVALYIKDFDYREMQPLLPRLPADDLVNIANDCLGLGISNPASLLYQEAARSRPDDVLLRNQIANTEFLCGRYNEARKHWMLVAHQRDLVRNKYSGLDRRIRFLGDTWLMAIGHVATLGTFIQAMRMGLYGDIRPVLVYQRRKPPAGMEIIRLLSHIIEVHEIDGDAIEYKWKMISGGANYDYERAVEVVIGHTEDFWYAPDLDGSISWYGPAGAAIDAAARAQGLGPALSYTEEETRQRRILLERLYGLPRDAWFVGLHVREPGFHGNWHNAMPGTRNADIDSYGEAVDAIIQAGGYVVRLGDPSMKPFKPRPEVIDYATSDMRRPDLDIFLCAAARFVIGTNSGYSLVPSLFGVRCLLTNWSPIGTPNWITHDKLVPKRIWDHKAGRYLSIEEMYRSFTGWSQFQRDFDGTHYEIRDNEPAEITAAVVEMLREVHPEAAAQLKPSGKRPSTAQQKLVAPDTARLFTSIVVENGGYVGSMLSTSFAALHPELLGRMSVAPTAIATDLVTERPKTAEAAQIDRHRRTLSDMAVAVDSAAISPEPLADDVSLDQAIARPKELGLGPPVGMPVAALVTTGGEARAEEPGHHGEPRAPTDAATSEKAL
ncbi:TIGR04372 family glycosyltransferase [Phreatobacter sp.]|uniref:TIGR04372 family glycosyltransferase n=1 Tax=Phreatobacter sp. TaxID=1966341 RepID=UPI0027326F93|nr:TIGR04372 family glycosyltransferase [Phreatobacter sp.]